MCIFLGMLIAVCFMFDKFPSGADDVMYRELHCIVDKQENSEAPPNITVTAIVNTTYCHVKLSFFNLFSSGLFSLFVFF